MPFAAIISTKRKERLFCIGKDETNYNYNNISLNISLIALPASRSKRIELKLNGFKRLLWPPAKTKKEKIAIATNAIDAIAFESARNYSEGNGQRRRKRSQR